jgi:hypothetical protein
LSASAAAAAASAVYQAGGAALALAVARSLVRQYLCQVCQQRLSTLALVVLAQLLITATARMVAILGSTSRQMPRRLRLLTALLPREA